MLTTIKPASDNEVTPLYTTQGVATLTIVGNDVKNEGHGWVNTSSDEDTLTIVPATGYDITSVKFKGMAQSDSYIESEEALEPNDSIYSNYSAPHGMSNCLTVVRQQVLR